MSQTSKLNIRVLRVVPLRLMPVYRLQCTVHWMSHAPRRLPCTASGLHKTSIYAGTGRCGDIQARHRPGFDIIVLLSSTPLWGNMNPGPTRRCISPADRQKPWTRCVPRIPSIRTRCKQPLFSNAGNLCNRHSIKRPVCQWEPRTLLSHEKVWSVTLSVERSEPSTCLSCPKNNMSMHTAQTTHGHGRDAKDDGCPKSRWRRSVTSPSIETQAFYRFLSRSIPL